MSVEKRSGLVNYKVIFKSCKKINNYGCTIQTVTFIGVMIVIFQTIAMPWEWIFLVAMMMSNSKMRVILSDVSKGDFDEKKYNNLMFKRRTTQC